MVAWARLVGCVCDDKAVLQECAPFRPGAERSGGSTDENEDEKVTMLKEKLGYVTKALSSMSIAYPMEAWVTDEQEIAAKALSDLNTVAFLAGVRLQLVLVSKGVCEVKLVPAEVGCPEWFTTAHRDDVGGGRWWWWRCEKFGVVLLSLEVEKLEQQISLSSAELLSDADTQANLCDLVDSVAGFVSARLTVGADQIKLWRLLTTILKSCNSLLSAESKAKLTWAKAEQSVSCQHAVFTTMEQANNLIQMPLAVSEEWKDVVRTWLRSNIALEKMEGELAGAVATIGEDGEDCFAVAG